MILQKVSTCLDAMLQGQVVLQPPHEDFVVNVFGQELVEGSYVQHDVGALSFVDATIGWSAPDQTRRRKSGIEH